MTIRVRQPCSLFCVRRTIIDKVIVTVLLIIGGVITSLAIFNGLAPAITESTGAINNAATKISDRIESRVEIIQASSNSTDVVFWVKNVGTSTIDRVQYSDVFYCLENNYARVTYGGSIPPYWNYQLEGNNSRWQQTVTLRVTIHLASTPSAGTYMVKIVIPNGISDETTFGVE